MFSWCETFSIDVHAYPYTAVEDLTLQIFYLYGFETWSLLGPQLIGVVEMGLTGVENKLSLPVAHGCRIVEYIFTFLLTFFNISKKNIGVQFSGKGASVVKLLSLAVADSKGKGILMVLEVIAGKSHLWKYDQVNLIFNFKSRDGLIKFGDVLFLFVQVWMGLAGNNSYLFMLYLLHSL